MALHLQLAVADINSGFGLRKLQSALVLRCIANSGIVEGVSFLFLHHGKVTSFVCYYKVYGDIPFDSLSYFSLVMRCDDLLEPSGENY